MTLAQTCKHPDARWLCDLFADVPPVSTPEQALQVFNSSTDARALCFAAMILGKDKIDKVLLKKSAESGVAFALACLAWICLDDDRE